MKEKENTKYALFFIILFLLLILLSHPVYAANNTMIMVKVNREPIVWNNTTPFIDKNDRTLVPLRKIGEALDIDVQWQEENATAIFSKKYTNNELTQIYPNITSDIQNNILQVVFQLNNPKYEVFLNGQPIHSFTMDTALIEKNGSVLAPIRYLAETFGCYVRYNDFTQTINIYDSKMREKYIYSPATLEVFLTNYDISNFIDIYKKMCEKRYNTAVIYYPDPSVKEQFQAAQKQGWLQFNKDLVEYYGFIGKCYSHYTKETDRLICKITTTNTFLTYQQQKEVQEDAEDFLDWLYTNHFLDKTMSEYERAKNIREQLQSKASYCKLDNFSYTAWSLYERKNGVCQAYTGAYNRVLKLDGIKCIGISGYAKHDPDNGHIWTLAILDGMPCYIDATWSGDNYFGKTAEEFKKTHIFTTDQKTILSSHLLK